MQKPRYSYCICIFLAVAAWLSGCAVYVPTVPSTPLLEKGQVEVTAGLRGFTSLEAGAAWAPTPHLLVIAESALQSSTTTTTTNSVSTTYEDYHRQASLGLGYYRPPAKESDWYLAAVGGIGYASVSLHSIDFASGSVFVPFPFPYVSGHYRAQYRRYYGQVYAAQPWSPRLTGGWSVRGTWADYARLTLESQPIAPANRFFVEPTFFLRLGRGALRGQGTVGLSVPTSRDKDDPLAKRTAPVSALISVGLVLRPDLLSKYKYPD